MKCKKWMALALAAVMAVGVLAGCGGNGSSTSSDLNIQEVNSYLKTAGSDVQVKNSDALNSAVKQAASSMKESGVFTPDKANEEVFNRMDWSNLDEMMEEIENLQEINPFIDLSYGAGFAIDESRLEQGVDVNLLLSMEGFTSDKVSSLGVVKTPEQFAAAIVLAVDETIDENIDQALNGLLPDWMEEVEFKDLVGFNYSVSATKVTSEEGVVYWVFGGQVEAKTFSV